MTQATSKLNEAPMECTEERPTCKLLVMNTGKLPIQVGSHVHFFEVQKELVFERSKAYGMRLNIIEGTSLGFEPGEEQEVALVKLGGEGVAFERSNTAYTSTNEDNYNNDRAGILQVKSNSL